MAENSKIEWTDHTFNPWIGCQKVSPGCDNCYAEALMDKRYRKVEWGPHGERKRTSEANWKLPVRWAKAARHISSPFDRPRVFCASLADVFDNQVPSAWRDDLWALIFATKELDWLLLTKRPENINKMLPASWGLGWSNVWLGTTAEDQAHYDRRWPILRSVPATVRFISHEPSLGCLWNFHLSAHVAPDWIICGGESGANARTMNSDWAHTTLRECRTYGIAFFMKQMTRKAPIPPSLMVRQFPRVRR